MKRGAKAESKNPYRSYAIPLVILQIATFIVPMVVFFRIAFFENVGMGLVDYKESTLDNLLVLGTDGHYRQVVLDTVVFGLLVTASSLVVAFPVAYSISRARRYRQALLTVVIVTSFTSIIIKVLGWRILLGPDGPVNSILTGSGVASEPVRLVNNLFGAVVGTTHAVVPLIILLLVPVIDRVPVQLEEASAGLGAGRSFTYTRVIIPACRAGLLGGALIAFAYAMGSFTTPALLGGKSTLILPILIRQQVVTTVNYPMAAALSLILVAIVAIVTVLSLQLDTSKRNEG